MPIVVRAESRSQQVEPRKKRLSNRQEGCAGKLQPASCSACSLYFQMFLLGLTLPLYTRVYTTHLSSSVCWLSYSGTWQKPQSGEVKAHCSVNKWPTLVSCWDILVWHSFRSTGWH